LNSAEHVAPQLMPVGTLLTLPLPAPAKLTVNENCGGGAGLKVAVTAELALMVMLQAPAPEQAPLHPPNTEPAAGVAARLTTVPELKDAEHVAPQLMPAGALVTVPLPVPDRVRVKVKRGTKLAATEVFAFINTVQVPVPVHAPPLHPVNTEPAVAAAVRITLVPELYGAEHVAPQLMPEGTLVTVPLPAPDLVAVRVNCGAGEKVAVAATGLVPTVKLQVPVPVHAPVQPAKTEAEDEGVAVKITFVPVLMLALHVPGQLMPPTLLVTDPLPVPATVTVTGNDAGMKFALTECAALIVTAQVPVPLQPLPLQPAKTDADDVGVAVSVTSVPLM
jgi:hypothetical protein